MNMIKYIIGSILAMLLPQKAEEIRQNFTIPDYLLNDQQGHIIARLIRFYLASKAKQEEGRNSGSLEELHKGFWENTEAYFSSTKDRTEQIHIPAYEDIVLKLIPLLEAKNIRTVYELGAGDGSWLNHLSQRWISIEEFVGIDISKDQIQKDIETYDHLKFVNSDLVEWAERQSTCNALYHTNSGVLEYLSGDSVKRLIRILKDRANGSILFFIEPIYGDYDIEKDVESQIVSSEYSYTHNYVHLLKSQGIEIIAHEEREVMESRMLIVIAYNN